MRAILVSVDYADLLSVTLPYNRHHFNDVMVVTSKHARDNPTVTLCTENDAKCFRTNSFYDNSAVFNKWKALEEGLDQFGRHGWLCIMDADVMWPKILPQFEKVCGCLYTPYRRMMTEVKLPIPSEAEWKRYPRHPQIREWAGFSQIFHAEDLCLGKPPWHETNWIHAGGADSFFQRKWQQRHKIRPPFDVLHLGIAGANWCGRVTNYLDGTKPPEAETRKRFLQGIFQTRRQKRNFEHEKIG